MTNTQKSKIITGYDIMGNIAIIKFPRGRKLVEKKKFATKFLKQHKQVTTVLEKSNKISGRLRTPSTKFVLGDKTKEALYKENDCTFRLNIDTCYFSPRLSSERKELAKKVKRNERVLVMFGGVAPFAIVIAKHSKAKKVTSIELGREPSKYAFRNVKRNKLSNVEIIQGNVRRVLQTHLNTVNSKSSPALAKREGVSDIRTKTPNAKYDRIVMARPNLKDTFLDVAFRKIKPTGIIHYYGFYPEKEKQKLIELIKTEAKKARKKIKILKIKKAGEIAAYKYRFRVDLKVLN